MIDVCSITMEEWKLFVIFFKMFLIKYKDYWIINNDIFKKALVTKYNTNTTAIEDLHNQIADVL